jgi:hypothetical protein
MESEGIFILRVLPEYKKILRTVLRWTEKRKAEEQETKRYCVYKKILI